MSDQDPSNADQAPEVESAPPSASVDAASQTADAPPAEAASSDTKVDLGKRVLALLIDVIPVLVVGFVIPVIGGLLGAAYMLLRDGMDLDFMKHRSIGKNVMKLHVKSLTGEPIDPLTSMKRNWLFAISPLAQAGLFIPILGWLFTILITPLAFIAVLVEVFLVLTDKEGRRLGDKFANTVVRQD